MKKRKSSFCWQEKRSCGRDEDLVKKSSVKSGRVTVEDQSFDTQRHLAMDIAGSLRRNSKMRSIGIGSEFSLSFVGVGDRESDREMVRPSSSERF